MFYNTLEKTRTNYAEKRVKHFGNLGNVPWKKNHRQWLGRNVDLVFPGEGKTWKCINKSKMAGLLLLGVDSRRNGLLSPNDIPFIPRVRAQSLASHWGVSTRQDWNEHVRNEVLRWEGWIDFLSRRFWTFYLFFIFLSFTSVFFYFLLRSLKRKSTLSVFLFPQFLVV